MTVIAIRNNIIAVDRRACTGNRFATTNKLFTIDNGVVRPVRSSEKVSIALAFAGNLNMGLELLHWFHDLEADPAKYPEGQKKDDWTRLVVVRRDSVEVYEDSIGRPIIFTEDYHAYGSGAHYALGAMAAGAQAVTAVGCTIRHCMDCGGGVDYVTLVDGEEHGTQS